MASPNVVWHQAAVTRPKREKAQGHRGAIVWFTGLSGSGKSTVAHAVEDSLFAAGCRTYVLDGDNVRHGLNGDLGFSDRDRQENIRRIGEVAKLFVDAGTIVLTAFISPFQEDRHKVRELVEEGQFFEVHCACPISICAERDVKGLYAKALRGEIKEFTGISSPYEAPSTPELALATDEETIDQSAERVLDLLAARGVIPPRRA